MVEVARHYSYMHKPYKDNQEYIFFYFENGGGLLEIFQINNVLRGFLVKMCNNFSHGVKGYETWGVSDET